MRQPTTPGMDLALARSVPRGEGDALPVSRSPPVTCALCHSYTAVHVLPGPTTIGCGDNWAKHNTLLARVLHYTRLSGPGPAHALPIRSRRASPVTGSRAEHAIRTRCAMIARSQDPRREVRSVLRKVTQLSDGSLHPCPRVVSLTFCVTFTMLCTQGAPEWLLPKPLDCTLWTRFSRSADSGIARNPWPHEGETQDGKHEGRILSAREVREG